MAAKTDAMLIGEIIEWLRETRDWRTTVELKHQKQICLYTTHRHLIPSIKQNPRIEIGKAKMKYKPVYQISSKAELQSLLAQNQWGLKLADLADSYPECGAHVDQLVDGQEAIKLQNADTKEYIIYPSRGRKPVVDPRIVDLWNSVTLPDTHALLLSELKNLTGYVPPVSPKSQASTRKRPAADLNLNKLTNTHLLCECGTLNCNTHRKGPDKSFATFLLPSEQKQPRRPPPAPIFSPFRPLKSSPQKSNKPKAEDPDQPMATAPEDDDASGPRRSKRRKFKPGH
jgi:hypothetical protein